MSASKETSTLMQLQQHVSSLNDQKNEVDKQKSKLLQKKEIAISDVSDKCMSLRKSVINVKLRAIRQLDKFYEEQEKLLDDALANLESRITQAEEELIIDLKGIPLPAVKAMSYDFDVTKAKASIDQIELRPSISALPPPPPGKTNVSTSKESETRETKVSTPAERARKNVRSVPQFILIGASNPKKPKLIEGQKREHVRDFINCFSCNKPRCIYRDHFLTDEEKLALSKLKDSTLYVCGAKLPTHNGNIAKSLVVEQKINCSSIVNWHYFQPKLNNPPVCYMCGDDRISPVSEEERLEFRSLHKICELCQQLGGKPRSRRMARVEYSDDESTDDDK